MAEVRGGCGCVHLVDVLPVIVAELAAPGADAAVVAEELRGLQTILEEREGRTPCGGGVNTTDGG